MVTKFITRLGIVRFIRGYYRRRRFLKALDKCDDYNRTHRGIAIIVSYAGEPVLFTKERFKRDRDNGKYLPGAAWGAMVQRRITRESLTSK